MLRLPLLILLFVHFICARNLFAQCDEVSFAFHDESGVSIQGQCLSEGSVILHASLEGGVFSGPGVSGQEISLTEAGPGQHQYVYSVQVNGTECQSVEVFTISLPPDISAYFDLADAPVSILCPNDPPVLLVADYGIGLFSGPGVDSASATFDPQLVGPGTYNITFIVEQDGLICESTKEITVLGLDLYGNPIGNGSALSTPICSNQEEVHAVGIPAGGTLVDQNGLEISTVIDPAALGAGVHTFEYLVEGVGCVGEASLEIVNPQEPAVLGPMQTTFCLDDDPAALISNFAHNPPSTYLLLNGAVVDSIYPAILGPGIFDLLMMHIETNGCTTRDSLTIEILDSGELCSTAIEKIPEMQFEIKSQHPRQWSILYRGQGTAELNFTNLSGQVCQYQPIDSGWNHVKSDLPSGLYLMQVRNHSGQYVKSVFIH